MVSDCTPQLGNISIGYQAALNAMTCTALSLSAMHAANRGGCAMIMALLEGCYRSSDELYKATPKNMQYLLYPRGGCQIRYSAPCRHWHLLAYSRCCQHWGCLLDQQQALYALPQVDSSLIHQYASLQYQKSASALLLPKSASTPVT